MRTEIKLGVLPVAVAGLLVGCGGSGGGGGSSQGPGSSGGSGSFTLNARLTVTGGYPASALGAGIHSFTLQDQNGDNRSLTNVFVPIPFQDYCTVIRANSILIDGTYSGTVAQCIDSSGDQATIPLNANGSLAEDICLEQGDELVLPVTAVGALTFENGIVVTVNAASIANNTHDNVIQLTGTSEQLSSGSTEHSLGETVSFTNGSSNSVTNLQITFVNSANTAVLDVNGGTAAPSKVQLVTGDYVGNALPYTSSQILYQVTN